MTQQQQQPPPPPDPPRQDIPFPFQPYPAQQALMQQLYRTLETGHVGLFESPTGTGKSLSLICASLHWLKERQRKDDAGEADPLLVAEGNSSTTTDASASKAKSAEPDWLRDYGKEKERAAAEEKRALVQKRRQALQHRLEEARQTSHRLSALRADRTKIGDDAGMGSGGHKKHRPSSSSKGAAAKEDDEDADEDLLPADYESGKETDGNSSDEEEGKKAAAAADKEDEEGEELDRGGLKILYCSRTHSQVSQFVLEIQKTSFQDDVRVVSLSSRKNLCINDEVLKLGSDGRISDRCLDMQKGKAKETTTVTESAAVDEAPPGTKRPLGLAKKKKTTSKKCPFLPSDGGRQQALYRDHALSRVRNLEDLADLGKKLGMCSYYGTRRAVAQAEVICMPYATLLHKGTRESMKIPLKGNVVLVDEAHNLIEAINAVHTNQLSLQAMSRAFGQVTLYWERYNTRLSGKNAFYVQQVMRVLKGLMDYVRAKASAAAAAAAAAVAASSSGAAPEDTAAGTAVGGSEVMSVNELLFEAGIDNVNLFKLVRYMEQSQIAKKVLGFAERRLAEVQIHPTTSTGGVEASSSLTAPGGEGGGDADYVSSHVSSLQFVQGFLATLTGSSQDGRIVLGTGQGPPKGRHRPAAGLKYIMLNAAVHFREVVEEARSVVLVGGTMQPVAPIVSQLFPGLPASRLDVFSCGHVIPPENLTALCMSKGPTGEVFDFTHKSRGLPKQMDELGRLLLNVCTVTPGGVVVFLPSYSYEEVVTRRWRETGLLPKLQAKKALFSEPKKAKDVDAVLQAYAAAIAGDGREERGGGGAGTSRGAILFCVVGAKMSEGINFADAMARCVVMVGLPYPDSRDPELQQKLQYLDSLQSSSAAAAFGTVNGKSYYQNLCMRAVNQSIGRAIRHANDWAAIILVDRRYFSDPSIQPLLPKWIADRVVPYQQSADFGRAFVHLSRFFRGKAAAVAATAGGSN